MSQDNIAVILIECAAKYLAHLPAVSSQLRYIPNRLYSFLGIFTFPFPFYEINNIDMRTSYSQFKLT